MRYLLPENRQLETGRADDAFREQEEMEEAMAAMENRNGRFAARLTTQRDQELHLRQEALDDFKGIGQEAKVRASQLLQERKKPQQAVRDNLIFSFRSQAEFELTFVLQLKKVPKDVAHNLIHISPEDDLDCELPAISVIKDTTRLAATMQSDKFSRTLLGDPEGIPLNAEVHISFKHESGFISLECGGQITREWAPEIKMPSNTKLNLYVSSPKMPAADAVISDIQVNNLLQGYREDDFMKDMNFDLPPAERRLLDEAKADVESSRKWGAFDGTFGAVLVVNSILVGLQVQQSLVQDAPIYWHYIDGLFLILFSVEWVMRVYILSTGKFPCSYYQQHKEEKSRKSKQSNASPGCSLRNVFRDPWMTFDLCILFFTGFDLGTAILFSSVDGIIHVNSGAARVIRILRLLRLTKIVRLVRAFRELGILVDGVIESFQTLVWTLLLLFLTVYVFGVILVKLSEWASNDDSETRAAMKLDSYTNTGGAMWALLSITTFNRWTDTIQAVLNGGSLATTVLGTCFLVFTAATGVCLLNVVVGVMCHTAFRLDSKLRRMRSAEDMLAKKEMIHRLRHLLKGFGERPLFKSDKFLETYEVFEASQYDPEIKAIFDNLGLTLLDIVEIIHSFKEGDQVEIDGIIEAIGIIELQRYFFSVSADFFENSKPSSMRPMDMIFFTYCNKELDRMLCTTENAIMNSCTLIHDTVNVLHRRSYESFTLMSPQGVMHRRPDAIKDMTNVGINLESLSRHSRSAKSSAEEAKLAAPIDVAFGIVIVVNGFYVGFQITSGSASTITEYLIDVSFTILFTIEFCLRATLYANLQALKDSIRRKALRDDRTDVLPEYIQEYSTNEILITSDVMEQLEMIKRDMRFLGIVPPLPKGGIIIVLRYVPRMLKALPALFDFVIVIICILDNLLSEHLWGDESGNYTATLRSASIFRSFRLFRISRVFRGLRLFPKLQMLMTSLVESWRMLSIIVSNLVLALYAFTLFMVVHVGDEGDNPGSKEITYKYFGNLGKGMLTGWQIITFDSWGEVLHHVLSNDRPMSTMFMIIMMFLLGLGLLKLAIGVMCGSAINLQRSQDKEVQRDHLVDFIEAMIYFGNLCEEELGTRVLPQEIFESALGIRFRHRRQGRETHASHSAEDGLSSEGLQQAITVGKSARFATKMLAIFDEGGLTPAICKQIFEKVDFMRSGYVTLDAFVYGAIVTKEDLAKVDLFACCEALRNVRKKYKEATNLLYRMHELLEIVLEDMHALIHRNKLNQRSQHRRTGTEEENNEKLATLAETAQFALDQLETNTDDGGIPRIEARGRSDVIRCTGRIKILQDEVIGVETRFRNEVRVGDLLVWMSSTGRLSCAIVRSVTSPERLKLCQQMFEETSPIPYVISRNTVDKVVISGEEGGGNSVLRAHELQQQMTPRGAQQFLDWEILTKEKEVQELKRLKGDVHFLSTQVVDLEKELVVLNNRCTAIDVFEAFKKNRDFEKELRKTKLQSTH